MKSFALFLFLVSVDNVCFAFEEEGLASWYGGKFHGRRTASGELFDAAKPSAAHKTLPFGTKVRVTNLSNGKSVLVRVIDRGPYARGRVVDLSRAAAALIGLTATGVGRVRIETLADIDLPVCSVQTGAFSRAEGAEAQRQRLESLGFFPVVRKGDDGIHRVYLPNIPRATFESVRRQLKSFGIHPVMLVPSAVAGE